VKKTIYIIGLITIASSISNAISAPQASAAERKKSLSDGGQGYGTAGCGLGSIIFGEKPGIVQIFAATTNGIYSHQTFAISSGTSNCNEYKGNQKKTAALFITANREALEKEISRGNGETVAHLSMIMGCNDVSKLGTKLQQNYGTIFPSDAVSSDQITQSIMDTVEKDSSLSKTCAQTA
jgi:hypothetical protein